MILWGDFLIMQIITILNQLQPYIKGGGVSNLYLFLYLEKQIF